MLDALAFLMMIVAQNPQRVNLFALMVVRISPQSPHQLRSPQRIKMLVGGADFRSLGDFGSLHRSSVPFSDQKGRKETTDAVK